MSSTPNYKFATTRWTLVMAAGAAAPGSREAISRLCELYWQPLYSYARRRGQSVEQAQDLTQSFFVRFLEKHDIRAADRQRGRFRSFLLSAFKHFMANEYDRGRAKKRGGGHVTVPLEFGDAEARYVAEPADTLTPEDLFERQWALHVIDRAMTALRADLIESGKENVYTCLHGFLIGEKDQNYAQAARALGQTEGAVKVTVHRLRRRLRDFLRAEIAATVSDDSEIEDEIRYLIGVVAS
jgi:RNA polymerase sigma factor (sigma-70 family)